VAEETRYSRDKRKRESKERHGKITAALRAEIVAEYEEARVENRPNCRTDQFPNPWTDWDKIPEWSEEYETQAPTKEQAQAACAGCPLMQDDLCYRYALATNQAHGIWGGRRFWNGIEVKQDKEIHDGSRVEWPEDRKWVPPNG